MVANKALTDATGDIISIGSSFDLTAEDLQQIPNAISNAKRNLGGDPSQISQGLANISVAAKEAGFSLQETADIVSLVQARTDQSGQAVATRLSRIFSILSGNTGQNLIADINRLVPAERLKDILGGEKGAIAATEPLKEQLADIAKVYTDALTSPELQGLIRNQLGGSSNVKELLPLLNEQPRLQAALERALKNPGAGFSEYDRKINNFIGTLNKIRGSIKNITVDLATSDIFAPFAAGIIVLERTLHLVDQLLSDFKLLTDVAGPLRPIITTGVEVGLAAAALKKIRSSAFVADVASTTGATGVLAGRVASEQGLNAAIAQQIARRAAVENAVDTVVGRAAQQRVISEEALVAATARATAQMNALSVGGAAGGAAKGVGAGVGAGVEGGLIARFFGKTSLIGGLARGLFTTPAGLATLGVAAAGGAYTLGHNIYSADQNIAGVQASNRKIGEQLGFGSSADDLRKAAQSLKTNAEQLKEEVGGISGLFVNPLLKDTIAQPSNRPTSTRDTPRNSRRPTPNRPGTTMHSAR